MGVDLLPRGGRIPGPLGIAAPLLKTPFWRSLVLRPVAVLWPWSSCSSGALETARCAAVRSRDALSSRASAAAVGFATSFACDFATGRRGWAHCRGILMNSLGVVLRASVRDVSLRTLVPGLSRCGLRGGGAPLWFRNRLRKVFPPPPRWLGVLAPCGPTAARQGEIGLFHFLGFL